MYLTKESAYFLLWTKITYVLFFEEEAYYRIDELAEYNKKK